MGSFLRKSSESRWRPQIELCVIRNAGTLEYWKDGKMEGWTFVDAKGSFFEKMPSESPWGINGILNLARSDKIALMGNWLLEFYDAETLELYPHRVRKGIRSLHLKSGFHFSMTDLRN